MSNNTGIKFGGRQESTPNKLTKEVKNALKILVSQEIELLPEHLSKLDAKDRIELLVKLIPYIIPKVESESHHFGDGGEFDWD